LLFVFLNIRDILTKVIVLKDEQNSKVPVDMFMMLAEDAKAVNAYAGLSYAGQQLLLENFAGADSDQEKKNIIEELLR